MAELEINSDLVGRTVANPARPEWGTGEVLRVQSATVAGRVQHRVSVQFTTGHRILVVPPARLIEPEPEVERQAGWLETLGKRTIDDRLMRVPEAMTSVLGTPAQRMAALAPLYEYDEEPASLIKWARRQANVADPLSLWSRDELLVAFRAFCLERDSTLRLAAAMLKQADGPTAIETALAELPGPIAEAMLTALRRPI